jgi:recombinational DNA repair protein RecR
MDVLVSSVRIELSCDWSGFGMSTNTDRCDYCWNHRKKSVLICTVETVKDQGYCSRRRRRMNGFSVL